MHYELSLMGRVLREARKAKDLTQVALAERTQVALRTIIAIENDQRYPTYEVFYKLIRELDISADHIFWPDRVIYTPEQEQAIREFLSCSEWEQMVMMKTMRALINSLRGKKQ